MEINPYCFKRLSNNFLYKSNIFSSDVWFDKVAHLAQQIKMTDEHNWLVYESDPYQYYTYFFALLIAKKNIVIPQSNQADHLRDAASQASIAIGSEPLPYLDLFRAQEIKVTQPTADSFSIDKSIELTFFTSGSSGKPKAIKKYWYQIANEIVGLENQWGAALKNTWVVATVSHQHFYGLLFKFLWPIFAGRNLVIESQEYPEQIDYLANKLTNLTLVSSPAYLARTYEEFACSKHIANIFSSGGPLANQVAQAYYEQHQSIITEVYGSTETGGIAWRQLIKNPLWTLFDEHSAISAEDGSMILSSHYLVKGQTIKTDDKVRLSEQQFELLGRLDRIVKLQEKRLSLDEFEAHLLTHPSVSQCASILLQCADKHTHTFGVVIVLSPTVNRPCSNTEKRELVKQFKLFLSSKYESTLLPKKWRFVEQLPHNSQGKLLSSTMSELFYAK